MDAVTAILLERSQQTDRLSRMVVLSLVAHGVLITAIALAPRGAGMSAENFPVMTISLGGAPGPDQGRTPTAAKEVQEVAAATTKPVNDSPPALAKPDMVEPVTTAKPEPKSAARPEPKQETPQLHGRKPTQGTEVKPGDAKVETHGAAIPFGGLATGGGGGGAAYTDYANFCCPAYLTGVTDMIRKNWNSKQGQDGSTVLKFTINRDGTITNVIVEEGSNQLLNLAAQRALAITQRVPVLPPAFTGPQLTLHLVFQYQR